MKRINIMAEVGEFAEDKDAAARIRKAQLLPALASGQALELDFQGVTLTTQSFIHALISQALRVHGEEVLSRVQFKGCVPAVKDIISTVVQYVLEAREGDA
jgi:hypothetical protein